MFLPPALTASALPSSPPPPLPAHRLPQLPSALGDLCRPLNSVLPGSQRTCTAGIISPAGPDGTVDTVVHVLMAGLLNLALKLFNILNISKVLTRGAWVA